MIQVNVLQKHPAYWYPIYLNRRYLTEVGLKFRFFTDISNDIYNCDVLFLSSRHFHIEGQDISGKQRILEALASLSEKVGKTAWFDLRDSSGNTQFEVLPYVTKYLKKQLLKDKSCYRKDLYGNRIYTDYYHREFGVEDSYSEECAPLPEAYEKKLGIGWNLALTDHRGGRLTKLLYYLPDQVEAAWGGEHRIPWRLYSEPRDVGIAAFFKVNYERNTVAFQRKRAIHILGRLNDKRIILSKKLPKQQYLKMLTRTKIVLSLFGWGELCSRDCETFIAGAALLMPDVSHLETWPDLYVPYETYWPLKWDLSDLEEAYKRLLDDEDIRIGLARSGQDRYREQWSSEGRQHFCERLKHILLDVWHGNQESLSDRQEAVRRQ